MKDFVAAWTRVMNHDRFDLAELVEKEKAVNFVLLPLFGSVKPKSSLFLARGGAHRAPPMPALRKAQQLHTDRVCRRECVPELTNN